MRILDRSNIQVNIRELGFGEEDYIKFQNIIPVKTLFLDLLNCASHALDLPSQQ